MVHLALLLLLLLFPPFHFVRTLNPTRLTDNQSVLDQPARVGVVFHV